MIFAYFWRKTIGLTLSKMDDFCLFLKKNHRVNPIQNGWFLPNFEENHRVNPVQNGWFLANFEENHRVNPIQNGWFLDDFEENHAVNHALKSSSWLKKKNRNNTIEYKCFSSEIFENNCFYNTWHFSETISKSILP